MTYNIVTEKNYLTNNIQIKNNQGNIYYIIFDGMTSLENAEKNAVINKIDNAHFLKANLDTFFKSGQLPRRVPKPDIVIVDPPRAGMHPDMSGYLHKLKADKIIYVSCNPTTQARDVQILSDNGYNIKNAVMVDMFPHTPHIEMVMLLSK